MKAFVGAPGAHFQPTVCRTHPPTPATPLLPPMRPPTQRHATKPPSVSASAASTDTDAAIAPVGTVPVAVNLREHGWDTWGDGKRLQCVAADVAPDTITIRSLDWDRDRFDIEFGLQEGTTYNAYVIFGAEKTALVDASHEKFRGLFMKALAAELGARGRSLDYVVVSHTEPDHSGLVPDVVAAYPGVTVVSSKVALTFLQNLAHTPFEARVVKGGDTIDLGGGHVLEFVMAPNLHWPDTIFTYDHATAVMYTCDAFGMHYCSDDPFDSSLSQLVPHYRFYYDCLMRPNAKSVTTALRKVKDLPYEIIANGHGPALRYNVPEMVGWYKQWSEQVNKADTSVRLFFVGASSRYKTS
jgi:flavorubredoxin